MCVRAHVCVNAYMHIHLCAIESQTSTLTTSTSHSLPLHHTHYLYITLTTSTSHSLPLHHTHYLYITLTTSTSHSLPLHHTHYLYITLTTCTHHTHQPPSMHQVTEVPPQNLLQCHLNCAYLLTISSSKSNSRQGPNTGGLSESGTQRESMHTGKS